MNTKEILTIIALAALGLCLLCSLAKAAMKGDKAKKQCDKACGAFVFLAIVLLAVSQLLGEGKERWLDEATEVAENKTRTGNKYEDLSIKTGLGFVEDNLGLFGAVVL